MSKSTDDFIKPVREFYDKIDRLMPSFAMKATRHPRSHWKRRYTAVQPLEKFWPIFGWRSTPLSRALQPSRNTFR
jgi:hypothetical protein